MNEATRGITKYVPKRMQHGLAYIAEHCPGNMITVDFTDPATCRIVITVPLEKPLTRTQQAEVEDTVQVISEGMAGSLARGSPVTGPDNSRSEDPPPLLGLIR
jgi:hypothetical protein